MDAHSLNRLLSSAQRDSLDPAAPADLHVLAYIKGRERYVFLWTEENRPEVLHTIGRFAANPELSLTWYDAAVLNHRIHEEDKETTS